MGIKFSIITVCRNETKTIRETMESILRQKWHDYEYIIIDGASTDDTFAIVQEYAQKDKRLHCFSEKDNGIFPAMNKGIRKAKGEFLLFLNAGDALHGDEVLSKAAELTEGADIVIGNVAFKTENGLVEHSYPVGKELRKNLAGGKNVCHQVIFASQMCLEDGFDEQFRMCADYDWLCRQISLGRRIVKVNTVVTDFDIHGVTGQAQYQKLHWKEYFMVLERHFPELKMKYCEEFKNIFVQEKKERFQYKFMNRWLFLKQRGVALSSFFQQQGIRSVAVYGMHYMGQRLYDELRESGVEVRYAIDRNPKKGDWGLPMVHPEDAMESVDAVVITPVFDFLEIKAKLSERMDCRMISIEEILFYEYETIGQNCGNTAV